MRRLILIGLLLILAACGANEPTPTTTTAPLPEPSATPAPAGLSPSQTPVPSAEPSATRRPATATAKPATPTAEPTATREPPTPLPTQPVPPEITAEPAEVDTPDLSVINAPPTPVPAAAPAAAGQPTRLVVPSVGIDAAPVSVGLDPNNVPVVPRHDVGWYNLGAKPGQGENVVFWGHVLRWTDAPNIPAPFASLQNAKIGDPLTVYTSDGTAHQYTITQQVWATPDQVQYILPVGSERVTLVSCIGDKVIIDGGLEMTHRLITIAEP